jgi:Zn-dependent protease with chaperone function
MNISDILQSLAGRYVTQSFLHAFIAVIITDGALRAWNIEDPAVKQRFRILTVLFPIFSFPFFQLINPDRGSLLFRTGALFDSVRWMGMELFGAVSLNFFFLFLLAVTALVFFFQELVPILRHMRESDTDVVEADDPAGRAIVEEALMSLPMVRPRTVIIDDGDMVLFSSTGRKAAVFVSSGLLQALNREQVRAALAHEIAHITRSRRPVLLATFLLRMIMFFNPMVLVEFRRAVRNEEKICDDIAVSVTGSPDALAETLKKFYSRPGRSPDTAKKLLPTDVPLEEYSHDLQLESRITRLEKARLQHRGGGWFPFTIVLIVMSGVCYFVV